MSIVDNLGGKAYNRGVATAERCVMSLSSQIILMEESALVHTTQRLQTSYYEWGGVLVVRLTHLAMHKVFFILAEYE
jgi:hypothetical protein